MLSGLKVIEYATYIAAPGAGGILADWGADVIKIEPPGGDPIRRFFETIGAEVPINPVFDLDNRGKRSIVIDAGTDAGRDIIARLVADADVFLTNVRPGGLVRSGLDPDTLRQKHPKLIYASLTGYGLTGPDQDRPGFDIAAFWSRSGLARLTAPKGVDPFPLRTGMGDHVASIATVAGILAAVVERQSTGVGRLVEASLLRAANYVLGSDMAIQHAFGRVASTRPREDAINPLANFFKTQDGRWLTVIPRQGSTDWPNLCRALGRSDWLEDPRFASSKARREHGPALVAALDDAIGTLDFAAVAARFDAEDLVWAPVQSPAEAASDPQLLAAGGVVDTPLPGGGSLKAPGGPLRFPGADDGPKGPSPTIGQHTRAVLAEYGFADADITALFASGVVSEG